MLLWLLKFLKLSQFSVHYFVLINFVTFFSGLYVWLSIQLKRLTAGTHLWRTRRKRRSRVMSDSYDSWDPQRDDLCWTADLIYQTKDQFIWLFQSLNWVDFSNKKRSMWFHMERALTRKEGKNQGRHDQEGRNYWIAYRKMSGRNMSKRRSWKEL